jgi:hypothetical protein
MMKLSAAGILGASLSGWFELLAGRAAEAAARGVKHKSCILLWMDGGPSHLDTFDPKPDASDNVRGEFKAISTAVPGIPICDRLVKLAGLMNHTALLRGMCTDEADHGRARVYMHSGYKPGMGGVSYPGLGSIVSSELGDPDSTLPNFVVTGTPLNKHEFVTSPGFLGPRHQPLVLADPSKGLEDVKPLAPADDFNDRMSVLEQLEQGFTRTTRSPAARAHETTLRRAVRLIRSDRSKAFDLDLEPPTARAAYGDSPFGRGCLLARRLVEAGVPFVEVYLANWDSHEKKVADGVKEQLLPQVDTGLSTLLGDLRSRGLLDSTLVIWMGEFGRTPRMNNNGGRDHYARAWSTVLAGGGIRGGQVIGKTDRDGAAVVDRPIPVIDFMATVCRILGIDHTKQIMTPIGRPIGVVDRGATPIKELLG